MLFTDLYYPVIIITNARAYALTLVPTAEIAGPNNFPRARCLITPEGTCRDLICNFIDKLSWKSVARNLAGDAFMEIVGLFVRASSRCNLVTKILPRCLISLYSRLPSPRPRNHRKTTCTLLALDTRRVRIYLHSQAVVRGDGRT